MLNQCEECGYRVKDVKEYWTIAGTHCLFGCVNSQWSWSDHHSHGLCTTCGLVFEKEAARRRNYGFQRQFQDQELKKKKDEASHELSLITEKLYREKFKTYLWHNANKRYQPQVVQARNKHFNWISVDNPQSYKYHCERQDCFRPLKSSHVEQVLNKLYCRPCSRTESLKLYKAQMTH